MTDFPLLPANDTFKKGDRVTWKPSPHEMGLLKSCGTVYGTMYLGPNNSEMTIVEVEGHSGSITISPERLWRIVC